MKRFEVGKEYATRSICDHECIFAYTVIGRTEKTVKIRDSFGTVKTCRINEALSERNNAESIYPEGKYSMAPIIFASRPVENV